MKPPKYKIGDLVLNSKCIVIKVHEKADRNHAYYLVHHIQSGEEEWLLEPFLDGTWDTLYCYTIGDKANEIQNNYNE